MTWCLDLDELYIYFDPKGHSDKNDTQSAVVEVVDAVDRIDRAKRMAVVDLPMIIEAKAQRSHHRWRVTDADREAIVADLDSHRAAAQRESRSCVPCSPTDSIWHKLTHSWRQTTTDLPPMLC